MSSKEFKEYEKIIMLAVKAIKVEDKRLLKELRNR